MEDTHFKLIEGAYPALHSLLLKHGYSKDRINDSGLADELVFYHPDDPKASITLCYYDNTWTTDEGVAPEIRLHLEDEKMRDLFDAIWNYYYDVLVQ